MTTSLTPIVSTDSVHQTLLRLSPESNLTRSIVADPHAGHAAVMKAFSGHINPVDLFASAGGATPDHRRQLGILHALNIRPATSEVRMVVQSKIEGDWSALEGHLICPPNSTEISDDDSSYTGSIRYEVTYNPIMEISRQRKYRTLRGQEQVEWWTKRAEKYGLKLLTSPVATKSENRKVSSKGFTLATATVQGVAEVVDREKFLAARKSGVGKARAYGCGLILAQSIRG